MAVGEWDQRQLCPDGSCIGVIGPDGTCKVCGRAAPNWGDERNRGLIDPPDEDALDDDDDDEDEEEDLATNDEYGDDEGADEDDDLDEEDEEGDDDGDLEDDDGEHADEIAAASQAAVAGAAPRAEWAVRQLCPDGACIGVIGPDGRCKVCGRRASDAPADAPAAPAAAASPPAATEPARGSAAPASPAPATGSAAPASPAPVAEAAALSTPPAAADPAAAREACPVTGCGGYIGDDGRCAVCGRGAS